MENNNNEETAKVVALDMKTFPDGTVVERRPDHNVTITRPGQDPQWVGCPSDYAGKRAQERNAKALYRAVVRTWRYATEGSI